MKRMSDSDIQTLRQSENRYRLLLDTMSHGVQENDTEGTITYSNRAHHAILGYENGELQGRKIWDLLLSSADKDELKIYFARLVKEQPSPVPYLAQNRRKDGSIVDLQIDWTYERNADGSLRGFISVITDITAKRNVEENLRRRTEGLSTLLEVSRSLASSLDLQHVLQAAVDGVTKLTGLDTAAVYLLEGDHLHLWATTPPLPPAFPDDLRIAPLGDHPCIRKAVFSGEPLFVPDMFSADLSPAERAVTEQRNLRTVLFVPMIGDAQTIGVFIVGSVGQPSVVSEAEVDLSRTLANLAALSARNAQLYQETREHAARLDQTLADRLRAENEKTELAAQLQQAQRMESIGRLAGGVAHDFNNMLSVILGHADLALLKADKEHPVYNDLLQIRGAAQRSANLTRQLLAFARKQTAAPEVLDPNEVIANMLQMLRRLIGEDIDLAWLPGTDLGLVKMDAAQVDQILVNLCVNARDAISVFGRVTIETDNVTFDEEYCNEHQGFLPGRYVMIAVSDDGVGMDKETVANIFEPYFSTKQTGKGTGLGLSTVYGIVKQNKGFIDVYSEPGRGTTFKIYLSRHEREGIARAVHTEPMNRQGGKETVLLVEDEVMILDLTIEMLDSLGYHVISASNPEDALLIARNSSQPIDLLITDVVMPGKNGRELAEELSAIFPDMKILYISGYTANVIAHHGVLHEGILMLSKPFSVNELALKVRQAIDM